MTFSVAARCPRTGELGVAVSTAVPSVGSICPFVASRVGAIATQSWVNPYLGIDGLALLQYGLDAQATLDKLIADDPGRDVRQLAVVDAQGQVAQYSGAECTDWFGHASGDGFGVQGNMLTGPEVIEAMQNSMTKSSSLSLHERLMLALEAGQSAGGDKRGRQSAALRVFADEQYPHFDLRVDEHTDPVKELRRIHSVAEKQFLPFMAGMPRRNDPLGHFSDETKAMLAAAPQDR